MKRKNTIFCSLMNNNEGSVLIMAAFFIVVLFALGGAGLDFGRAYLVKMKSQQASDAAALAGANPALPNPTYDDRKKTATMYYNLNFPENYLGVKRPEFLFGQDSTVNVTAGNSAAMNTNFIRTMGSQFDTLNVSTQSKVDIAANNPKYDVILVLDTSDSMDWMFDGTMCDSAGLSVPTCNNGSPGDTNPDYCYSGTYNYYSCGTHSRLAGLQTAANTLTRELIGDAALANDNRVAVIFWNDHYRREQAFTNNEVTVRGFISAEIAVGGTNSTAGLAQAQIVAANFRPDAAHVVVLLTDGMNTGSSSPAVHDQSIDDSSIALCNDFKSDSTIVYTVAVGDIVKKDASGNFTPDGQIVNNFLSKCASGSPDSDLNQYYYIVSDDASQLNDVFKTIADNVQKLRITE